MNRALLFPLALVPLALTAAVATLDAQEPTAPPIRVDVQEVMVPVTVRDAKGRFVSNLEKSDFKIYDQGKEVKAGMWFKSIYITTTCEFAHLLYIFTSFKFFDILGKQFLILE